MRAEDLEEGAYLIFNVYDMKDNLIRTLKAPASPGINRISWDLRYADVSPVSEKTNPNKNSAFPVMPGTYKVSMSKNVNGVITLLTQEPVQFQVTHLMNSTAPAKDRSSVVAFQSKVAELQKAIAASEKYFGEVTKNLDLMKQTILVSNSVDIKLLERVKSAEMKLEDLKIVMFGNSTISGRNENQTPSINDRFGSMAWSMWDIDSEITGTAKTDYDLISKQLKGFLNTLNSIVQSEIAPIQNELQNNNAPWTPGRVPNWD